MVVGSILHTWFHNHLRPIEYQVAEEALVLKGLNSLACLKESFKQGLQD
jgi:hypothetical protein